MMVVHMKICDNAKCTGCFACMNICPKGAISVQMDKLGKTIPQIDSKMCVSCGACQKVCPENHPVEQKRPVYTYAVWSKNENDVKYSSSGGAAAVFGRFVLRQDGVVFGSASMDGTIKHIKVESENEMEMLRGSKYVQSEIGYSYREVKNELDTQRKVLFIGTPCQVAGLKNYLHKDYENLFTIDLVCHGTPPISYLHEHLVNVLRKNEEWEKIAFRGEYDYSLTVEYGKKILYQRKKEQDTYFKAFLDGLICRDNCYICRYSCPKRVSDITVADFWGIDRTSLKCPYNGKISLVLSNTEKGNTFFQKCENEFFWEKRTLEEAMNPEQGNLLHPSMPHKDRDKFVNNYVKYGFEKAVRKTSIGKNVKKERIKEWIKKQSIYYVVRNIKRLVRRDNENLF